MLTRALVVCPSICLCLFSAIALAKRPVTTGAVAPMTTGWSPQEATGAPNCPKAGDSQRAWATKAANAGEEWLELDYATAVPVQKVIVHQNDNPGAIVRVEARNGDEVVVLWKGTSPKLTAPAKQAFKSTVKTTTQTLRIVLDTRKVPGWNEIDAVELIGRDGSRQWATAARASSTYATTPTGIWAHVGRPITLLLSGREYSGVIQKIDGEWATLVPAGGGEPLLINLDRVDWIRGR